MVAQQKTYVDCGWVVSSGSGDDSLPSASLQKQSIWIDIPGQIGYGGEAEVVLEYDHRLSCYADDAFQLSYSKLC